jgi:hypothetical protein
MIGQDSDAVNVGRCADATRGDGFMAHSNNRAGQAGVLHRIYGLGEFTGYQGFSHIEIYVRTR